MKKRYSLAAILVLMSNAGFAQNYVSSGGYQTNFGIENLSTSPYWGTDRGSTPGFFAAVGSGTYTGADATHAIDGYVKYYGDGSASSFAAPVGWGNASTGTISELRTLTVSGGTLSATSVFATAWFSGSPSTVTDPSNGVVHPVTSVTAPITSVSTAGFWDWIDYNSSLAGKTITVTIPDVSAFSTASNLRLVGWNGSSWVDLSGGATASGNTAGSTLSGTMLNNITALAIGTSTATTTPDLTPSVDIDALSFSAGQERDFIVDVFEIAGGDALNATQPIQIAISRLSAFDITVPGITLTSTNQSGVSGTSSVGGGRPNENGNWQFRQTASFIIITSKAGTNIAANSLATLGLHVKRKAGVTSNSSQSMSISVINGSGGEIEYTNNGVITTVSAN